MRTWSLIAALFIAVFACGTFVSPSEARASTPETHVVAASAVQMVANAVDEDCGACLFCGKLCSCVNCHSAPVALATATPFDVGTSVSMTGTRNYISHAISGVSGPYRPPRA